MDRSLTDASLKVTKAIPAANANNTTDAIDLAATSPGHTLETVDFVINVPATPALADTKSHTLKIQDSANGTDFTDVAALATRTRTGAGGAGAAAVEYRVKLPPSIRRYVRVYQAVESAGGDSTGVSITVALKF
jgi:hypothetical protein